MDIVKTRPGITLQELTEEFPVTRYAVMKHLRILERANLIVFRREGKFKHFYLNSIPIQMIHDRWLSEYTKYWSTQLTQLKYNLEMEDQMNKSADKQIYVLYIKTTREKLWEAITSPAQTRKYFFNTEVNSGFVEGQEISYLGKDGEGNTSVPVKGEIIEAKPYQKLVHTFRHNFGEGKQGANTNPSRVTYEIEPMGELVKLTLVHDQFGEDRDTFKSTSEGWPMILNGLKTLLETGRPLEFPQ